MKTTVIVLTLIFAALLTSCGEPPDEDSQNIAAILSPDGSKIAFVRSFRYYVNKASVFDPSGYDETVYAATFIYTMNLATKELTKLVKVGEEQYYYDRYNCPVNVSWEGNSIAYSSWNAIYIMDSDGSNKRLVVSSIEKYGPSVPYALSADAQRLFYLQRYPLPYEREGLYSIGSDGTGRTFVSDLGQLGYYEVQDMIWDPSQNCILLIGRTYGSEEPPVWQINPDGTNLRVSEQGLKEYRRRRLGGWESDPPFSELDKLTHDFTHAEWGVPAPDEF